MINNPSSDPHTDKGTTQNNVGCVKKGMSATAKIGGAFHLKVRMQKITMISVRSSERALAFQWANKEPISEESTAPTAILRSSAFSNGREMKSRLKAPKVGKNKVCILGICNEIQ
ncbi:hypothetical protein [Paenibacillus sp. 2TAB26]|uniref:hypothetical protein n=1 Tax=Paenibacillus sp. 2TAB26 TaxID=3233005 RepID=UPI003F9EBA81